MNIIERLQNPVEGIYLGCYGYRMRWVDGEWVVYRANLDISFYPSDVREIIYCGTDEAAATLALSDAGNE